MKFPQYGVEFDHEPSSPLQCSAMYSIAKFAHENGGGGEFELHIGTPETDGHYVWASPDGRRAVNGWKNPKNG